MCIRDRSNIRLYTDSIRDEIMPYREFQDYLQSRIEEDNSRLTELEIEEFISNYTQSLRSRINELLNLMVEEYSQ